MEKIISEELNFDNTIKYGIAMKQRSLKVEKMRN